MILSLFDKNKLGEKMKIAKRIETTTIETISKEDEEKIREYIEQRSKEDPYFAAERYHKKCEEAYIDLFGEPQIKPDPFVALTDWFIDCE